MPTDDRWLDMTYADILWEFRQIVALDEEKQSGKQRIEGGEAHDPEYERWQKSLAIM